MEDNQWYQNYMEQLKENMELRKEIDLLKAKLSAIQEILTPAKKAEETGQGVSVFMQNKMRGEQ